MGFSVKVTGFGARGRYDMARAHYYFLAWYNHIYSYRRTYTHPYECTHAHHIPISTSEILSWYNIFKMTKSPQGAFLVFKGMPSNAVML